MTFFLNSKFLTENFEWTMVDIDGQKSNASKKNQKKLLTACPNLPQ